MACFRCVLILLAPIVVAGTNCPPESPDTGQSKASELLVLEGKVGGTPADFSDGVMAYCPIGVSHCLIQCKVSFFTPYSPSHSINGRCYSPGGMGRDLAQIGINATNNHPKYAVRFLCHAINSYRCVMNATIYSQKVTMRPVTTACATPPPLSTRTPPHISNGNNANDTVSIKPPQADDGFSAGNATNDTTTVRPPTADDGFSAGGIAGTVVGGLVIVVVIATFFTLLYFTWVRRDALRSRDMIRAHNAHPHNEPLTDAKLDTADDNGAAEMVFSLTNDVSGGEWLRRFIAVTRGPRKGSPV